ncbi:MAG TPA: ATP-binding protein [Cyclobacteriaceae bacterium]
MSEPVNFEWLKRNYFSNPEKQIKLRKGEILLEQNQKNKKLFLVLKGRLQGYLPDEMLSEYPIFESAKDRFIGVYSYFSEESVSYSRVIAAEDSTVAYYDRPLAQHDKGEYEKLMPFLMSVVVNELSSRQNFARHMAKERHQDLKKLLQAEKMATLGQMAAGLAHELNNSVGVIVSNLDQLEEYLDENIKNIGKEYFEIYESGKERGKFISSAEARQLRKSYEKELNIDSPVIRKLTKTGIDAKSIKLYLKSKKLSAEKIYDTWELGCTLYDMKIAARHSSNVVHSVKELGGKEMAWSKEVDINQTLHEALVIVGGLVKKVSTEIKYEDLPLIEACPGELIQVWINLIKNAVEAMLINKTDNPVLKVITQKEEGVLGVTIGDNGPGVPDKIKNQIFEPSFTTKIGGLSFGLGLGLTIAQRIINEHNGSIRLESQKGNTEFTVSIPITNHYG